MTEQLAAATVGFVSAVFLCIGSALNTPEKILLQSTPYWDFNEPVARALVAQRAQYIVGGLLLVIAFLLQIAATLASSTTPAAIPQSLQSWPSLVLAVLAPTSLLSAFFGRQFYIQGIGSVLALEAARRQTEQAPPGRTE